MRCATFLSVPVSALYCNRHLGLETAVTGARSFDYTFDFVFGFAQDDREGIGCVCILRFLIHVISTVARESGRSGEISRNLIAVRFTFRIP